MAGSGLEFRVQDRVVVGEVGPVKLAGTDDRQGV